MKETIESISQWAEETFGPATLEAQFTRAMDEIEELSYLHYCLEHGETPNWEKIVNEAADVCITLDRLIHSIDPEAIDKKMAINRARKWKVSNGVGQHVREKV